MHTKFQLDRSMHSQVMVKNAKCAKKMKKLFQNFASLYLGIGWRDLLQMWFVVLSSSGGIFDWIRVSDLRPT